MAEEGPPVPELTAEQRFARFFDAANLLNAGLIQNYIENGLVDVNARNDFNETILWPLITTPRPRLLAQNALQILQYLIDHGVDVNARDNRNANPVELAVRHNKPRMLEILLQAGANVNNQNNNGESPIFLVRHPEIARMLVNAGANVTTIRNNAGQNAMEFLEAAHIAFGEQVAQGVAGPFIELMFQNLEQTLPVLRQALQERAIRNRHRAVVSSVYALSAPRMGQNVSMTNILRAPGRSVLEQQAANIFERERQTAAAAAMAPRENAPMFYEEARNASEVAAKTRANITRAVAPLGTPTNISRLLANYLAPRLPRPPRQPPQPPQGGKPRPSRRRKHQRKRRSATRKI